MYRLKLVSNISVTVITLSAALLYSQEFEFQREIDSIPFIINGVRIHSPLAGGIGGSKPVFVDIDNDNDLDLVVGSILNGVQFYRNTGTAAIPTFLFEPESLTSISVGAAEAPVFVDIDSDGDLDLFVGERDGNINFYRNNGTPQNPVFTLETTNFESIDIGDESTPSFADIDNDGDLDLFVGEEEGNLNFYRNSGTPQNPVFALETANFDSIDVGFDSSPKFVDIDNDEDLDLFIGRRFGSLVFYRNIGNITNPIFTLEAENFNIDVGALGYPTFADIENDDDLDLFIGEADGNLNFYPNSGTANNPVFSLETENFASFDVGYYSSPTFGDIDDDGDYDLIVNEFTYRNTGSLTAPSFSLETGIFNSIEASGRNPPRLADIDSDGDLDLFEGDFNGNIIFYRNTGTITNPIFVLETENFESINVGEVSYPSFADIDNDGDLDLFVGESDGNINFYKNTGTPNAYNFNLDNENFASIDVGLESTPNFVDIDSDGDLDLFVGDRFGTLSFYRNTGSITNPNFSLETTNFNSINVGISNVPAFVDIDRDGDHDLFVGNFGGGLHFYRNLDSLNCFPNLPTPNLTITGTEDYLGAFGDPFTRYFLTVTNRSLFPNELFEAAPDLPPCGLNTNASRTWVDIYARDGTRIYGFCALSSSEDLNSIWFAVPQGESPPDSVFITLTDRRCDIIYTSNLAATAQQSPNSQMEQIYNALKIENLQTDKSIYTAGEQVEATYDLVNRSDSTLVIPLNTDFSQPFYLVGIRQHWIERLGPNSTIPSIPANIARDGARYAAGGAIIPTDGSFPDHRWPPSASIAFSSPLGYDTSDFPAGTYRFYTEYKRLFADGSGVIQTETVDFMIEPPLTELIAGYPLSEDANDVTGNNDPMTLTNTPFQDSGIFCNGIYRFSGDLNFCHAITPQLNNFSFEAFTISAEFKVDEVPSFRNPVFVGGDWFRWIGFNLEADTTVSLLYNNSNILSSNLKYSLNTWHEAKVTYVDSTGEWNFFLDNAFAGRVQSIQLVQGNDINVGITNFSNGTVFKGIFRELRIQSGESSGEADLIPPQISFSAITSATSGQSLTVQATLTDNVGIQSATLFYRQGGAPFGSSASMTNTSGDTWEGTIPPSFVTERGLDYYFSVQDNSGNVSTFPSTNAPSNPQVIQVTSSNLSFSSPNSAYRMISVPIDLENSSPSSVLEDDLGSYDDTQWRLLKHLNGSNQEFTRASIGNFAPGSGFWLITRGAKTLGTGSGVSVTTGQNYIITLQPGWNQIGNPFAFTVFWSDVINNGNVENQLVGYQGSSNEATGYDFTRTQLVPFEGYFVNNLESSATTIEIQPIATGTAAAAKQGFLGFAGSQSNEWTLQITAQSGHFLDKDNYIGVLNDAADTWDRNDFSEAPFFDNFVSLYFPHEDWEVYPGLYTGDFRSINSDGHFWDFHVKSNIANSEVVLTLANIQNLPSETEVVLIDKASRISINFLEQDSYTIPSGEDGAERDFRIVVGKADFVDSNDLAFAGIPEAFSLSQNYPNPFNPETHIDYELPLETEVRIAVFNLLGQQIRSLFNGKQNPGRYTLSWDGRSEGGLTVSSGVYLVRMRAGKFVSVRKVVLAK